MERVKPSKPIRKGHGGRPKGSLSYKTMIRQDERYQLIEQLEDKGIMPVLVMLDNMVFYHTNAPILEQQLRNKIANTDFANPDDRDRCFRKVAALFACRRESEACAVDAAPYLTARLASITLKGDRDNPLTVLQAIKADMSPKEAADLYAKSLRFDPMVEAAE